MTNPQPSKEEYAKIVCLFLAELLRTRKITLMRAAEVCQKVTDNINLVDSEVHFLSLVKQLSADFEELTHLQTLANLHVQMSQRTDLEEKVRAFVISTLVQDPHQALEILQEAVKADIHLNDLVQRFPQFQQFINLNH
jgi:hypothetical protein